MNFYWNIVKAMWSYHHNRTVVPTVPSILSIEPTNLCQLNCVFCARDKVAARGVGLMTRDTMANILKNSESLRNVSLFMHGEPLLHPELVDLLRMLRPHVKSVSITTNGLLLDRAMIHALVEGGMCKFNVSFEGTTKQVYESVRRGGSFERVSNNLLGLLRYRREVQGDFSVKISVIDMPETHDDLPAFIEYWTQQGIDHVIVLPLHDWGGQVDVPMDTQHTRHAHCFYPFLGMYVLYDGTVSPCCLYEDEAGLGNLNEQSAQAIWNNAAYQEFRRKLIYEKTALPICRTCQVKRIGEDDFTRIVQEPEWTFPFSRSMIHAVWFLLKLKLQRHLRGDGVGEP